MFCITWYFDRLRGHCTGVAELECSFDHVGTMCVSVADGVDPKQGATVPTDEYTDALGICAADVTVGVLEEGFGHDQSEAIDRALDMLHNTAPFDNTGHPAISVPAGTDDRILVGTMFVGDAFDDESVLGVADAFAGCIDSGL